jgi:hypothetical protein
MSDKILGVIGHTESRGKGRLMRKYALVFFPKSVVAAKIGGILGTTLGFYFGQVGLAIYNRRLGKKADELKDVSMDEILKADEDNFVMQYKDISKIEMKKGGIFSPTKITFSTKDKKYSFNLLKKETFNDCVELIKSVLPNKTTVV